MIHRPVNAGHSQYNWRVCETHSEIGGQRSVQQVPRHSDQAPHTLDSWAHKKELTVSHQMPNAQDQDQTDRADIHGEGWCGTLLQIVCNHATQIGDVTWIPSLSTKPSIAYLSIRQRETTGGKVKPDLLINLAQKTHQEYPGAFDVKVLDGSAVVHFLPITNITTFNEYTPVVSLFPTSWHTWILPKELTWSGILTSPAA